MAITELKDTPGYVANPLDQQKPEVIKQSQASGDTPPPVSSGGVAPQVSSVVPGKVIQPQAQTLTPDLSSSPMSDAIKAIEAVFAPEKETEQALPNVPDVTDLGVGIEIAPVEVPTQTIDGPDGVVTQPRDSIFLQMAPEAYGSLAPTMENRSLLEQNLPSPSVTGGKSTWERLLGGTTASAPSPSFDTASAGQRAVTASALPDKSPLSIAQAYMGFDERRPEEAQVLSSFFSRAAGLNLNPADTAWCAGFVNAVLGEAGLGGTGKLNARSFLNYGQAVEKPQVGDIVVFSRGDPNGWQGHVGFIAGVNNDGSLRVLGGNQSTKDSKGRGVTVNISTYSTDRVLGYRRPVPVGG